MCQRRSVCGLLCLFSSALHVSFYSNYISISVHLCPLDGRVPSGANAV